MNTPEQELSILNKVKILGGYDIAILPYTFDDLLRWRASPSTTQLWDTYEEAVEEGIRELADDCI